MRPKPSSGSSFFFLILMTYSHYIRRYIAAPCEPAAYETHCTPHDNQDRLDMFLNFFLVSIFIKIEIEIKKKRGAYTVTKFGKSLELLN